MRGALLVLVPLFAAACGANTNPVDAGASDLSAITDLTTSPDLTTAPADLEPGVVYTVMIRGTLKNDVATSQTIHDQIVANGEATAKMLGDTAHYVYLNVVPPSDGGVSPPSTEFLAIDEWTSLQGFMTFTSDPNVAAAFAMLFAAPPSATVNVHPSGWTEWGVLDPTGQPMPLYLFSVRAPLIGPTTAQSQTQHNMITSMFMSQAMQAGDVGHRVFLSAADMTQFQSIDLWSSLQGALAVYSNPSFQAAFGSLFSAAPTIEPYVHTNWAQY